MTKVRITITVDEEVLNDFKRVCKENDIKVSTKINSLIKKWISDVKRR